MMAPHVMRYVYMKPHAPMRHIILAFTFAVITLLDCTAQRIVWTHVFTHENTGRAIDVTETADGGYLAIGSRRLTGGQGLDLIYAMRMDPNGNVLWERAPAPDPRSFGAAVTAMKDGSFIATGIKNSSAYVVRFDASGNVMWERMWGKPSNADDDQMRAITRMHNSDVVVAGNGVRRYDTSGNLIWANDTLPGGSAVEETGDGGVIIAGTIRLPDRTSGDTTIAGDREGYIARVNAFGAELWRKRLGGAGDDWLYDVVEASDGGFVFVGSTMSFPIGDDVSAWIVGTDRDGNQLWYKTLNFSDRYADHAWSIRKTFDDNYVIGGSNEERGAYAGFVAKIETDGDTLWTLSLGNVGHYGVTAHANSDGSYVFAGTTLSPQAIAVGRIVEGPARAEYESDWDGMRVMPNPTRERVSVRVDCRHDVSVAAYDVLGARCELIGVREGATISVSTSELAPGAYVLEVRCGAERVLQALRVAE